jgi:hypothetical protein
MSDRHAPVTAAVEPAHAKGSFLEVPAEHAPITVSRRVGVAALAGFFGLLPFWESFRRRAGTQAVMRGITAAVAGLLGARRSTRPSGPARSNHREISPWRGSASSCSWGGRRRRLSLSP